MMQIITICYRMHNVRWKKVVISTVFVSIKKPERLYITRVSARDGLYDYIHISANAAKK